MAEGEFALVRQHLEAALPQTAEWVGDHDLYAMLADAAALAGDLTALQRYAPRAEESAVRYDHRLYRAIAHRAFGVTHRLAGEPSRALARLEQALELFSELETSWQTGRTYFELGKLAQGQADASAAARHFTNALAEFERQGAGPDVIRTRAALAELGGARVDADNR
jgi:tetratricopeptide (TPR) repeat protein